MALKYKGSSFDFSYEGYPFAFDYLDVGAVAQGLTVANLVNDLVRVLIKFENGPGRYRVDGGVPSEISGIFVRDGDAVTLNSNEAAGFYIIRIGATNIQCAVTYYRITGT